MKELTDILAALAQQLTLPLLAFIAIWIWKTDRNIMMMHYKLSETMKEHESIEDRLQHVEDTLQTKCPVWERQRRTR